MFEGIDSIKVGTTGIGAAYVGTTLVYSGGTQPIDYSTRYFTTRSLADNNTIQLSMPAGITTSSLRSMSYSTDDGATWTTVQNDSASHTISVTGLSSGDTVLWSGDGVKTYNDTSTYCFFNTNGEYEVEGNILSLVYGSGFTSATTASTLRFGYLFKSTNQTGFCITAKNLVLPYSTAFAIYRSMFYGQKKLTEAPVLRAASLSQQCYYEMFNKCSSLNYVKCLATSGIGSNDSTTNWLSQVAANGTFVKKAGVSWPTGNNGIPSGWTVVEEP